MCGVFGINSNSNVVNELVEALSSLEYRGYDSAGVAGIDNGELFTVKTAGKVKDLKSELSKSDYISNIGIAHTRWATHGGPSSKNAHPHSGSKVAIVHNGIIENNDALKSELIKEKIAFESDTDSETILHLIEKYLSSDPEPFKAVKKAVSRLKGSFAILAIFKDYPDTLIAVKNHSPLAIGYGKHKICVSSDAYALAKFAHDVSYLQDGDIAVIHQSVVEIFDATGDAVKRDKSKLDVKLSKQDKGNFSHYMQKEIFEQPMASKQALIQYIAEPELAIKNINIDFTGIDRICIVACGTSYFAGMVAKCWLEDVAKIHTTVEIASEFCGKTLAPSQNSLGIFISQSGETADTIRALQLFKQHWVKSVAIVNVEQSTIARNVDVVLPIYAGQEIGVASTKAFTNQLVVLACLAIKAALDKKSLTTQQSKILLESLLEIPGRIAVLLGCDEEYKRVATSIIGLKSVLYIGRGTAYALGLEGALKLKEISYIHAEAVAAGELKHGHIALVDQNMYVVAILPPDRTFDKALSNVRAATSREAKLVLLSDSHGAELCKAEAAHAIIINHSHDFITPFLYVIPLQLIAYHAGVLSGNDVDQPRNLSKAVAVE